MNKSKLEWVLIDAGFVLHDADITLYTIPPDQSAKIAELEDEIASLKEQMEMNANER
jgi:hypothetical protein